MVVVWTMTEGRYIKAVRWSGGSKWFRAFAPVVCLLAALPVSYAQQASTPTVRRPTLPSSVRRMKLRRPGSDNTRLPVVAVVHRLGGWRLRALLARPGAPLATTFDDQFVRTNIVAGYVLPDGRSVVARLPRADAEMLDFSAQFRAGNLPANTELPLSLVRGDGVEFKCNFVGFDASTGLSLLEADGAVVPPAPERTNRPAIVGQRVRLIAPVPSVPSVPPVASMPGASVVPSMPPAAPAGDSAPFGEAGMIYMNMNEAAGQVRQIKRSPTGKMVEFTVEVNRGSPEWAGGVALGETGLLVGIVNESGPREARLVSAETVRAAAARVLARRASVPQPWLGARGDAVAFTPLDLFVARGWPEREARSLVNRHMGVLLTDVAPGTPAAVAGLRPGDVVARISQHEVRSIEDMSLLLQELGGNSVANFTVLRAQLPPLDVPVRLSETQNPALETAQAEARAAEAEMRLAQNEARLAVAEKRRVEIEAQQMQSELRTREEAAHAADAARREAEAQLLRAARQRVQDAQTRVLEADARLKAVNTRAAESRQRRLEAETRIRAASAAQFGLPALSLLPYGVRAIRTWPPGAERLNEQQAGLLVMSVSPKSSAARAGLKAGDIIEMINDKRANVMDDLPDNAFPEPELIYTLGVLRDGQQLTIKLTRAQDK